MDTKKLRQKILDLAIHGKLVPQDSNDEPASVLLERIRAEKKQLIKEGKIKKSRKTSSSSDTPHYEQVPFEVPDGWVWTTLGEISTYGECNTITIDEIGKDAWILELEDLEKDTAAILQTLTKKERSIKGVRHKFCKGEVLYSKLRTYLNKVLVAPNDGYCTTEIMPFNSFCSISTDYLCHVLRSSYFLGYTLQCGYGVKMPRLSTNDARKGMIPLPPLAEQLRIVNEIERLFAAINTLENSKTHLHTAIKQAKNKILDLAIHGKLVPQDPNDEPASELLKRINPKVEITCDNAHYGKLPDRWCLTKLGAIGRWQSGGTPSRANSEYYVGDIPWLKIADLQDGYVKECSEKISNEAICNSSAKINPEGSIALAMYGSIGKLGILTFPAATNQAICVCSSFMGVDAKYLFFFLMSQRDDFVLKAGGGVQANISKEIIINHRIAIPPLPEQLRIVSKIENLFSLLNDIESSLQA